MNILANRSYRNWFVLGLLVQVVAACFSVGWLHPDEHYQILEFYNYKRELSPVGDLPWEFGAKCRTALQPFIVYGLSRMLEAVGIISPFVLAFVLRLLMGVLTWFTTCRLILLLARDFSTEKSARFFAGASLFLWFIPYLGVRFSSETIAADFFFLAISLIIEADITARAKAGKLLLAGTLLGFSLFLRLQMGFAFVGLAIWILFIKKMPVREWIVLVLFALVAIGASVVVDHWYYNAWVFTPYNYFNVNIVQNVAAKFGVFPWYYYFPEFLEKGVPPISVLLLVLFFVGVWKKPLNLFSLVAVTFFLGHFLIGHKELRFLFPASIAFIYMISVGFDHVTTRYTMRKGYKIAFRVLVVANIGVLAFKAITPSKELINYYSFIYSYAKERPTEMISFGTSPYLIGVAECNFYKPRAGVLPVHILQDTTGLANVMNTSNGRAVIYLSSTLQAPKELAGYKTELIYCQLPGWVLKFNINNWQERSLLWAIFRVYPK